MNVRIANLIVLYSILLFAFQANGQESVVTKSDSTAKIDGLEYLIHATKAKETLFSIAKTYEVKISRLAFDNPGVLDGLKLGQHLRILKSAMGESIEGEQTSTKLDTDGEYVLYTVPKKQTLYAISKEFNTTVSALQEANPELKDGLKVGSTIRVPVPKMLGNDQTEKVEMVGLPSMVKKEVIMSEAVQSVSRGPAHVTLLLPLHLIENDTVHERLVAGEPAKIYEKSEMALQFYEGFLLALDTLDKMGYKVKLKVVDTENRPWTSSEMTAKGWFENAELIFGPFYSKVFTEAANYAMEHKIPIVSPTIKGNDIVVKNPYVFKMLPTEETLISDMGRYLSRSDSTNNIILHYGVADEQAMIWRFKQGLEGVGYVPPKFPTYDLNRSGLDSLRMKLSSSKRNNIVILSNNQVRLAGLLRKLSGWAEDRRIMVFTPESWKQLKNLEVDQFDHLKIHMPVAMYVNYEQTEVQEFVLKFREKFFAEPSSFAFRGYDLAMHFIRNMDGIRKNGVGFMESVKETGFQTEFSWKRLPEGGFENAKGRMVDHTDLNMKLAVD